ncbi:MAG TPA: hypothetical protein VFS21_39635 [Roseiflexaceae bacterium]|nr:hypothetical protein [Roseiflexaceae bacterium]
MHNTQLPGVADRRISVPETVRALPVPRVGWLRVHGLLRAERISLALTLGVALVQGLLYMLLVPPWQHYDEPTHFEYAWLIANRMPFPEPGDEDQLMRREVAASMLEHDFFYPGLARPNLLTDHTEIWLGISELNHPPLYYTLVSLPLRLARHLDITSQLYLARGVSLLLFVLTVATAWAIVRELTQPSSRLRWLAPLAVALLPPFVDIMTSVNNDVGAVLACSLFVWGCVRTIRAGPTWRRALWVVAAAVLSVAMKNTAAVALLLTPVALGIALWVRRGWRWRWLVGGVALGGALALLPVFAWGDSAYWYRWSYGATQPEATQARVAGAPLGEHAVVLDLAPGEPGHGIVSPLPPAVVASIAGKTVTVGGWIWADQPVAVSGPGPLYNNGGSSAFAAALPQYTLTTTPTLVIQRFSVPTNTTVLHLLIYGAAPQEASQIYLDGAFLIPGEFPADTAPRFDDARAATGEWNGQRFTNLIRNGSAEQGWPRLRPWVESLLFRYIHRSPSQTVAALFDVERVGAFTLNFTIPYVIFNGFGSFAWGQVRLQGWAWAYGFALLLAAGLCGGLLWLWRRLAALAPATQGVLLLLGAMLAVVWLNVILRPLPLLETWLIYPAARYGFPAIVPSMLALAAGWLTLWPPRWQRLGAALLAAALFCLNICALWTIQQFFHSS